MFDNVHRVKGKHAMDDEIAIIHEMKTDTDKVMISTKI